MKKCYSFILISAISCALMFSGCSNSSVTAATETATSTAASYSGQTLYGKVTAVGDNTLTISSGQEYTIPVSDDTTITRQASQGGPGGMPGQSSGSAPEMPSDDNNSSNTPPTKSEGDGSSSDNTNAQGDSSSSDNTPPAKPDSDDSSNNPNSLNSNSPADSADKSAQNNSDTSTSSDNNSSTTDNSSAPDSNGGTPDANTSNDSMTLSDISVGDIVSVSYDDEGNVSSIEVIASTSSQNAIGGPGQSSGGVDSYTSVNEYTSDTEVSNTDLTSTGTDENAALVDNGASVSFDNVTVSRDSDDSTGGDNSSFYGVGAAILTTDGTSYINNSTITSDAKGGAGIFAYGDNSTVYAANTTITTTQDTSGGIHAAGGGTLYAWDMDVTTSGESSAAIRSDRGGGTMVVDGGSYTSNGTGSPAVYSTADIAVNNADLTANGSEAVCIEGLNSLRLFDCNLTGNMSDNEQNDCTWNVILYQSMSGDSEVGNSTFEMNGGSLTAKNGGMFYTTNTESTFILNNVDITYADDNPFFLKCTGNSNARGWGNSGSNGADCHFTAINQAMSGDIIWDSISQLDFYMTEGSTLTGAVVDDESNAGNGGDGYCNLYIASGCTWVVTGDSTVSSLSCAGTITDANGNSVTVKGSDGTVYAEGTSDYTITVSSYSDAGDVSGASTSSEWSAYSVEKPAQLG